ncbi:MBL fold metallo-hydrolase [Hyella patelloides]|nr:MBL fold metallo-hydrolase [Hyella patelloides]
MSKLLFLGSGSAFTVGANNFQSNILLIHDNNQKLLLDCGSDIRFSLYQAGFSHLDITDIYISHLHSDHVGGLEYIGFNTKFDPKCDRPNLYIHEQLKDDIWQKTLAGGMSFINESIVEINSFFKLFPIASDRGFNWNNINFKLIKVVHINKYKNLMPSYGLFFAINKHKIFLTTDTQFCPLELSQYYEEADSIYQDCETTSHPTEVHAHYQQLKELPSSIKNKMWLYGYQPGELPSAKADGFQGFVKCGQVFNF